MAKLDDKCRAAIVQALACFDTPTQVVEQIRDEFGIAITRQQVQAYDPTKAAAAKGIAKKWRALFEVTRAEFLKSATKIPIANQSFRLRSLQRLHELAVNRRNAQLAAQILEQAAKETGGMFTNRREIGGPNGGPIPVKAEHLHTMSDDDLERIARGDVQPAATSSGP
jgi:hypothetical protein